ncbi:MAG: DUF2997 domain-containing protein [Thermoguttaceae bacterium]|jgi:hypothetical protein
MKLPREVKIHIRTDGKVEIETFGFVGESCAKLSEVFERALAPEGPDSGDKVVRELKPEYYVQEQVGEVDVEDRPA